MKTLGVATLILSLFVSSQAGAVERTPKERIDRRVTSFLSSMDYAVSALRGLHKIARPAHEGESIIVIAADQVPKERHEINECHLDGVSRRLDRMWKASKGLKTPRVWMPREGDRVRVQNTLLQLWELLPASIGGQGYLLEHYNDSITRLHNLAKIFEVALPPSDYAYRQTR